ncbi:MAG TPA: hypothetical protein VJV75_13355 [Candidatus Polarisedimenticolia bacterium]|nr:hypothetical protein [Candidatus Polarisedimenticolia bacterium]
MIRLVNRNEWFIPWMKQPVIASNNPTAVTNALVGYAPTASKICDVVQVPFDCLVLALVGVINTIGVAGNSTDLKCAYRLRDGGYDLAGTTIVTDDLKAMDLNLGASDPARIPAAGTRIVAGGLSNQAVIEIGSLLHLHYNETGTLGTATRPIMNPVGVVLKAIGNVDPRDISSKH